jgi:FkbM family methyltransferase
MKNDLKRIVRPFSRSFWRARRDASRQQKAMVEFYRLFVQPGDLCFDVGANVGNRTEVFLRLGARVVAIEPQQDCMGLLKEKFSRGQRVYFIGKALGESPGRSELLISDAHTISSMSKEWIENVKKSGRFAQHNWSTPVMVDVTTLDALIAEYGVPSFVKIDVEGYEAQVMQGLTQPVRALSFEFAVEAMQNMEKCIQHLMTIGPIICNYSLCESMTMHFHPWVSPEHLRGYLQSLPDRQAWGDVYVSFDLHKGKA